MRPALERAKRHAGHLVKIELEVDTLDQLAEALEVGVDVVLLDNMTPEMVDKAVERIKRHSRRLPLEASGGINLQNVRSYAETGVDFISVGALTHSFDSIDISMKITPALI